MYDFFPKYKLIHYYQLTSHDVLNANYVRNMFACRGVERVASLGALIGGVVVRFVTRVDRVVDRGKNHFPNIINKIPG
jgi:hypothetical protein